MANTGEILGNWAHRELLDVNGEKIGIVEDVRYDDATAIPKWLMVKTGLFGSRRFVPAGQVRVTSDRLRVSFTKDRVKNAPDVGKGEYLSSAEETELTGYYGLDYLESPTEFAARR